MLHSSAWGATEAAQLQVRDTRGHLPPGRPSGRLSEACCYSGLCLGSQQAPPYLRQQVKPSSCHWRKPRNPGNATSYRDL